MPGRSQAIACGRNNHGPVPIDKYIDSDGIRLHCLVWAGRGKSLILLAGLGDTAHYYRELAPRFTDRFRVAALTRRGHGRSDKPGSGYDLDTLVKDIVHFLDPLGIDRVVFAGASFVGVEMHGLAVCFAERVEALISSMPFFPNMNQKSILLMIRSGLPDLRNPALPTSIPGRYI